MPVDHALVTVRNRPDAILGEWHYGRLVTLSDSHNGAADEGAEVTVVRHLVDAVGSPLLHVLAAPQGLDRRVRTTVLYDPTEALAEEPDALLLMAGVRADDPGAVAVARAAADAGYCAIVVKRRGAEISALVTEASIRGVAVLATADEVPWRHLDSLLLSVLGSQGVAAASSSGAGDELFTLANAIAAVIGGSVAIEDMERRIVAYSSVSEQRIDALREEGILARRVPDMARNPAQYRAVLGSSGVVRFPEQPDELARAAVAIKAGNQPLGTIWAIESEAGLDSAGDDALVEGARLAALNILRGVNTSGVELQLREGALLRALDGSLAPNESSFRLSLPGGAELGLVGFAARADADGTLPLITHIAGALAHHVSAYRPDAAMATTARAVYVLIPGGGTAAARRFATGAAAAARGVFSGAIRAAVASTSTDPADLPRMRREIDDILRVLTDLADLPEVAEMGDVRTSVLLAHVTDLLAHEPGLAHPGVAAMTAFDTEHHSDYSASVSAWLGAVGDVAAAAGSLGVHPNTLRYRLRRAAELFDLGLDHPDNRLAIWMQLRLATRP